MEWINNPWIVGIGGGVLSGILVTVVSRVLLSRRDRREYIQKLLSANREVIYAIRPGISEGHVPDRRVVESLINATARKYIVDKTDLYNPTQVGEELTKEIMDSSFISANTKQQYCDQLGSLSLAPLQQRKEGVGVGEIQPTLKSDLAEYRSRMVTKMSMMLGIMSTLMTAVIVFSDGFGFGLADLKPESLKFLIPTVVALSTVIIAAILTILRREFLLLARKRNEVRKLSKDITPNIKNRDII